MCANASAVVTTIIMAMSGVAVTATTGAPGIIKDKVGRLAHGWYIAPSSEGSAG